MKDILALAETDPALDAAAYKKREAELRAELLVAQYDLLAREDRAILFVVSGLDGAGKGSAVNLLNEWMDPRHLRTLAFGQPTPEALARPAMWRYWRELPPRGRIGIVFGSWYQALFAQAMRESADEPAPGRKPRASGRGQAGRASGGAEGASAARQADARLQEGAQEKAFDAMAAALLRFEAMLVADGVQIVKLWFHLSRDAQRGRCERLAADPDTAWRVSEEDLQVAERFGQLRAAAARVIAATDVAASPWQVIPSADDGLRAVRTGEAVLTAMRAPVPRPVFAPPARGRDERPERADEDGTAMKKGAYEKALAHWQARLGRAVRDPRFAQHALVLVFEGKDAAGKGGAIRRVAHALDVRQYRIVPVSAPNDIERAHPYLWRFWQHAPTPGRIVVFDRSWYGRVLVERVEKLVPSPDWERAFEEINEFEAQWAAHGTLIVKFWLDISDEEQLRRFQEREQTPFKNFKITADDWRNRRLAPQYRRAAADMLALTDTPHAPWHVIATDDKRTARVDVLRAVAQAVEHALAAHGDSA